MERMPVKGEEDEIPLKDIGCKPEDLRISGPRSLQRILHRTHGPPLPTPYRPLEGKGGLFGMPGEEGGAETSRRFGTAIVSTSLP